MEGEQSATQRPGAILLTGVYGTGKSTVAIEMAGILEERERAYALLDLDFLCWYHRPGSPGHDETALRMRLANLRSVVANYRTAAVDAFVLAGSVQDGAERDRVEDAVGTPMLTVRLTVPFPEIERRLRADVTSGRRDDLREAANWAATGRGAGFEDLTVANEGPIHQVALSILRRAGWA
jgi:adenylylsulfate kinase-like enzyme